MKGFRTPEELYLYHAIPNAITLEAGQALEEMTHV